MSKTLMRHPDHPDRVISIPLNEWARYRRSGYEFCNEVVVEDAPKIIEVPAGGDPPAAKAAVEEEPSQEAEEPSKGRRRTTARQEE